MGNTENSINWGKVVKGAAIVTSVAVAAVVAYYAVPAVAAWAQNLITDPTTQTLLSSTWEGLKSAAAHVGEWAHEAATAISQWWQGLPADLGLKNTFSYTSAEALTPTLGKGAAVVAGAAAIPAASHAMHNLAHHTMHTSAEHHEQSWADRNPSRRTNGQGFAAAAPKPAASHIDAESIRASTAQLNKDLGI